MNAPPVPAPARRRAAAAFTMVEIAISIAVVAFALVAILGVLPTGFDVQRRNRESTIIHQDASIWMEALRGGAWGLDYLTNHVDALAISGPSLPPRLYDGTNGFRTGREIIGLLTQPALLVQTGAVKRLTTAYVRAISGPAGEKTPRNDFAFTYRLTSEIIPLLTLPVARARQPGETNFLEHGLSPDEQQQRRWHFDQVRKAEYLQAGSYELRLTFEWPVYFMNNRLQVGDHRKVYRTLVTGERWQTNDSRLGELNWLRPFEPLPGPTP